MKITTVIAAYNEVKIIAQVVRKVEKYSDFVVVVDDGSTDNTSNAIKANNAVVLQHPFNMGQGAALQTGIDYAKKVNSEIVVTFDADGQFLASDIPRIVEHLIDKDFDVVLGSRFLGKAINISLSRKLLLKLGVIFTWIFSGIKLSDTHNGFRAFNKKALAKINIKQNRMTHASEILHQISRSKLKFTEVPITVKYFGAGQKNLNSINIALNLISKNVLFSE